jgi:hypothetical protein
MATPQYRRPPRDPDLEARVTWSHDRAQPVRSGIRPIHDFSLGGELYIAMHEYPDAGLATPGTETRTLMWLLAPDAHDGRFYPGFKFTVLEGGDSAASGEVVRVLNKQVARDS